MIPTCVCFRGYRGGLRGIGRCALSSAIDWRLQGLDIRGWRGWRYIMIPTLLFCFREE